MDKSSLGSRIERVLFEKKIKKKTAAEHLGINPVTFSKYLSGLARPKPDKISQLAELTKCSLAWLLTGDDEPYPEKGMGEKDRMIDFQNQLIKEKDRTIENLEKLLALYEKFDDKKD